ncbi:MAG: alanine/glycine:cation symporter family protein [Planctomycetota bacterium]|jgi:AGCS family alanine or glycine:cation symporter
MMRHLLTSLLLLCATTSIWCSEEGSAATSEASWQTQVNDLFATLVGHIAKVLFYDFGTNIPFIIMLLVSGGLFFTVRYAFVNARLFRHAIHCVQGKYDDPDDDGEISHFKALTSALSATVGLGNIAGVAVAITAGGPGAVFWMWLVAFLGMSMKFSSCTLAQVYRRIKPDGSVLGGPMVYLEDGLKAKGLGGLGKALAVLFAILCIGGSIGGGNLFQGNQTYTLFERAFLDSNGGSTAPWIVGLVLAVMVGLVIIGGIKRIGTVTSRVVPMMCVFYCIICLFIIMTNAAHILPTLGSIFSEAFSIDSAFGGFLGVMVQGMKRAAFSNEAGLGAAAIAHAAAKTKEPIREGTVAMLGPFIDTILVCTMTALTILISGAHLGGEGLDGVAVTARAFEGLGGAVPYVLFIAVCIFAYSTMISWSYYGERCAEYLFGSKGILPYRIFYVSAVVLGPVLSMSAVIDFSDLMLLSMAFPNIIGMVILSGVVRSKLRDYEARYFKGEMPVAEDWKHHHPQDLGPAERQHDETDHPR